jgi:hypothetical protein
MRLHSFTQIPLKSIRALPLIPKISPSSLFKIASAAYQEKLVLDFLVTRKTGGPDSPEILVARVEYNVLFRKN